MKLWPESLRWQMAATAALSTAAATIIVLGGTTLYYAILERIIYDNVSVATRQVIEADPPLDTVDAHAIREINQVIEAHGIFRFENAVWIALLASGVAAGGVIGAFWGGRVGKPIEGVARAAASIIGGDLTARAPAGSRLRGEPAKLVKNFNRLAEGLEEAERELTGSTSAIAHELRTPVTILRARLQAVRDGVFTLSTQELDGLIAQADLMTALIDDMRVISLASARRLELQLATVDLAAEARSVMSTVGPPLVDAGLRIETDLRSSFAFADRARVRQILNALLDNVRRYAAHGGVVRVETHATAETARLIVADRGPGVPDGRNADLLFDRFWRGEPSRSRDTGGTGLGLAVVKAIAEAHGGSAKARNRDGGGALFEISFPTAS